MGPTLLDLWEKLYDPETTGKDSKHPRLIATRKAIIADHKWLTPDGSEISHLPNPVELSERGTDQKFVWPPKVMSTISQLVSCLQASHYPIVALSTGARWSEIAGAKIGCVVEEEDGGGYWVSRTWKLEEEFAGRERRWPLPPDAIYAIRQQERLAKIMHSDPDLDHLWVNMRSHGATIPGHQLKDMNEIQVRWVKALKLTIEGGPHTHRWRKTIARLCALAMVGAPKILMDLFGHRQIDMTLRYILSNPAIRLEIEDAAKAALYAKGKDIAGDSEKLSGPRASDINEKLSAIKARHGPTEFGVTTIDEATEILALSERSWTMIRPNIVCTKQPSQTGKCTRQCGFADPARCTQQCEHRVELAGAKHDADAAISLVIAKLESAETSEFARESYKAELVAQLKRWPELREKHLKVSKLAKSIWQDAGLAA